MRRNGCRTVIKRYKGRDTRLFLTAIESCIVRRFSFYRAKSNFLRMFRARNSRKCQIETREALVNFFPWKEVNARKKKKEEGKKSNKRLRREKRGQRGTRISRSGEINRGAGRVYRIKATQCARTRRNSSGFRQAAGSCAAWLRSVTHRLPAYQWTRPRATCSRSTASPSLSLFLSLSLYRLRKVV